MLNEEYVCDLMKKGIIYLSLSKFDEAISCFDEILSMDDNNLAALNNKALSLNGLGQFNDAIKYFDKILSEDYEFIFSLFGKGESLYYLEFYDLAIDYFNRVLELDSMNDVAIFYKALCYNKLKQYGLSIKCLDQVKSISGDLLVDKHFYRRISNNSNKELFDIRSQFINKINNFRESNNYVKYFEVTDEALNFDQKSTFFLLNKACSLYYLKSFNESLIYVDKILNLDFMNIDALFIKSHIFANLNQYINSLNCLNDILRFGGTVDSRFYEDILRNVEFEENSYNKINSLIFKGNDHASMGEYNLALDYYNKVLDIDSKNIIALNNKGFMLYLSNKYDDSINIFNQVLSIQNNYVGSLLGKSYSLYYLGRFNEALMYYNIILDIDQSYYDEEYLELLNKKLKI